MQIQKETTSALFGQILKSSACYLFPQKSGSALQFESSRGSGSPAPFKIADASSDHLIFVAIIRPITAFNYAVNSYNHRHNILFL